MGLVEQLQRGIGQFCERSEQHELMDNPALGGELLAGALGELRVINLLLGGARPTVEGVERLWRAAGCPHALRIVDVGAGSGESSAALLRWAARRGVALHVTLVDLHPETCAAAARFHAGNPALSLLCADALRLPAHSADIVTASLFTHHFPTAQLPALLLALARTARIGVVVNDLQRHPLAWLGIWLGTRLLSRNQMIRHDAPLSVLRGFVASELEQLRATPGLEQLWFAWRPVFRWLLLVPALRDA